MTAMSQGTDSENDFESADEGETVVLDNLEKIRDKQVDQNEKKILSDCDVSSRQLNATRDKKGCNTTKVEELSSCVKELNLDKRELLKLCEDEKTEIHTLEATATESVTESAKQLPNSKELSEPASLVNKELHLTPLKIDQEVSQENKTEKDIGIEPPSRKGKVLLLKEKRELERTSKLEPSVSLPKGTSLAPHPVEEQSSPGWGLVGGWSSSFLSSMASSASTFTSHVTQGIGTVLETMEASLGAPSPEEMAAIRKAEKDKMAANEGTEIQTPSQEGITGPGVSSVHESGHSVGGLLGGVSAFTRVLESTGSKVITGSLDTLELIGKKTMDILTEGDPGFRKKRTLFGGQETTLSQVLRDARDKSQEDFSFSEEAHDDRVTVHYSKLFDEFQGLVHLEALEILSGRSKTQLEEQLLMLGPESQTLHQTLQELKVTCLNLPPADDTPDDETTQDFEKLVNEHMSALTINLNIEKIKSIQLDTQNWIRLCKHEQDQGNVRDAKEIYVKVITALAELTARAMELFHKMTELLLVAGSDLADLRNFARHFTGLTGVLCTEVGILASQFCHCLSTAADDSEDPDAVNPLITNVYLEAANSNTYIQDAFQLLIPIFQEIAGRAQSCKNEKY